MKFYSLPYGRSELKIKIDSRFEVDEICPVETKPLKNAQKAVQRALENPLGERTLNDFVGADSVGIAINDKTRPIPNPNPLPLLLDHLDKLGFSKNSIILFIGSGTHTPMSHDDYGVVLPQPIINNYQVIPHDCDNTAMIDLGKTSYCTPIKVNREFYSCKLKITIGNIEPHHFMGFSGGVKTAAIGLASRETITHNHAMLIDDQARSGTYHRNPLRKDVEEIGKQLNIQFTLGSILEEDKTILEVFFGNPQTVMEAAIPEIRSVFGVEVPEPYDLVIASPGGSPKDINLYQAEKGLTHAARITKNGGNVILLAECSEGSGSTSFEDYITKAESLQSVIKDFNQGYFKIGPHKAYQIAREAQRVKITLVSDLPAKAVENWKIIYRQHQDLDLLIDQYTTNLTNNARIAIMPAATRTMTELKNETE
ncbi:MAG: nickel-dependent lactate racemase [Anaerolineales bacterium]|nr:nickel-dependent lactate racemase [Anaerolineales bacterium]